MLVWTHCNSTSRKPAACFCMMSCFFLSVEYPEKGFPKEFEFHNLSSIFLPSPIVFASFTFQREDTEQSVPRALYGSLDLKCMCKLTTMVMNGIPAPWRSVRHLWRSIKCMFKLTWMLLPHPTWTSRCTFFMHFLHFKPRHAIMFWCLFQARFHP